MPTTTKKIDGCSMVVVLQTLTMHAIIRRWQPRLPTKGLMLGLHPRFYSGETQSSGGQVRTSQARSALGGWVVLHSV